jgi:hypothetical protein
MQRGQLVINRAESSTVGMTKIPKQDSHDCAADGQHYNVERYGFGHHCRCCEPNQDYI